MGAAKLAAVTSGMLHLLHYSACLYLASFL